MTNTICSHSMVQYGTVQNTLCLHLYCTWADLAKNSISRHELTTYKISDFIFTSPHHNYFRVEPSHKMQKASFVSCYVRL